MTSRTIRRNSSRASRPCSTKTPRRISSKRSVAPRCPLPFDSYGRGDGVRLGKDATSTPSTRRVPPAGLCVLAKDNGHVMLGKDYIKTVERGIEVDRTQLSTEKEWRDALEANFGITL